MKTTKKIASNHQTVWVCTNFGILQGRIKKILLRKKYPPQCQLKVRRNKKYKWTDYKFWFMENDLFQSKKKLLKSL